MLARKVQLKSSLNYEITGHNKTTIISCFAVCVFIFLATKAKKKDQKKVGGWFITAISTFVIVEGVTEYFSK